MITKRFLQADDGVAMVFVALTLPVLIGMALLAIDASRIYNLHNELQQGADAFALAGAAELDGSSSSITRANRAITNLVQNKTYLSDAGLHTLSLSLGDVTVRYLTQLPASDETPIPDSDVIIDPATEASMARFVEVTIKPTAITSMFPLLPGGRNTSNYSASAVAGFRGVVCNFTPFWICNPYGSTTNLEDVVSGRDPKYSRRNLIELRPSGGSSPIPGNFGYLQPPNGKGAPPLEEAIASDNPDECFVQTGVSLEPGAKIGPVNGAFNVRFDIYDTNFNKYSSKPHYRPALNVRKGYSLGTNNQPCNAAPAYDPTLPASQQATQPVKYMPLPRDNCFLAGVATPCPQATPSGNRIGDGYWDFEKYWTVNHPSTPFPNGWSNANPPSRYDVYLAELGTDASHSLDQNTDFSLNRPDPATPNAEDGKPACYTGGTLSADPDRRLVYGAILDCSLPAIANAGGSSGGPFPVETWGSFFLTQPTIGAGASSPNLYVELVDVSSGGGSGTMNKFSRDEVQLYR